MQYLRTVRVNKHIKECIHDAAGELIRENFSNKKSSLVTFDFQDSMGQDYQIDQKFVPVEYWDNIDSNVPIRDQAILQKSLENKVRQGLLKKLEASSNSQIAESRKKLKKNLAS
jgi:hypothetical protein